MKRSIIRTVTVPAMLVTFSAIAACQGDPVAPITEGAEISASSSQPNACWGQASAVFAQMGLAGEHASQQANPRVGLRNLARQLFEAGAIPDDSMAALGAFVAAELGLSIEACM